MDWQGIARKFLPLTVLTLLDRSGSASRPTRRHANVAVMFADIEGCTRLCEDLSPSEMSRVVEAYFTEYLDIVRHEGGEVTEVLGDGLLALFEGSSLREDATRAIRAALRIRRATQELNAQERGRHDPIVVNIGLNTGTGSIGITRLRAQSGERWVYAANGPVTNIAARLCALATRGQILISERMAKSVQGSYQLRALGPRTLKNVSRPIEVFEILPDELKQDSRFVVTQRSQANG